MIDQASDTRQLRSSYDYVIVGAGAAGCVLAGELSASGAQVLLIESGGTDDAPTVLNPSVWFYNVGGPLDYHLPVTPSPRLNNRNFNMALGHVLGGGSSINAMVWMRGTEEDYDGWAENGARGWAFADVLPIFKNQEDWEGGANAWRGAGGPIHIRRPKDPHITAPAFIDAAREMGMPILDDVNGPLRPGAGYINMNIAADGTRVSAARAFLHPALSRPNLTLLLNTSVVKLIFKGTRCVGVKLMTKGVVTDMAADKEVILAAGTINSPKLLMLSGVGEAQTIRSFGIDVVENLPGVGGNLQDHVLLSGVVFKYKGKMPDRPADSNAVDAEAYLSSGPSSDIDTSLVLHQLAVVTPEVASRFGTPPPDAFTIAPALVQPTSTGSVRLASGNFQDAAVIDGSYLDSWTTPVIGRRTVGRTASGLIMLADHPRPDVGGTIAEDDPSPGFVLSQETDGVAIGKNQIHEIEDKDVASRLGVEQVAQFVHILRVKSTADREHNGSAARAMNSQHRPRRSKRNCRAIRRAAERKGVCQTW